MTVRSAAVAGTWYPASPARLSAEIDDCLARADASAHHTPSAESKLTALIAPHAGLLFSGPVAAHAYRLLRHQTFEVIVLVGPSHYVPFEGVSVWPDGSFETPLGLLQIDGQVAAAVLDDCAIARNLPAAHEREHSLEMQLPFLATLAADAPIVPLVMGLQTRDTAFALGECLARVLQGRRALLIASSDLSHFHDARTAASLDARVIDAIERFDDEALMTRLEQRPDHACGGGAIVAVMRAAKRGGATTSRLLKYADSGDVSGDKRSVVGYLAAALWQ
jgi:MEMO1 family protein